MLIELDRAIRNTDRDWSDYLVVSVRDFLIWGMPPIGAVDAAKAEWLASVLSHGGLTRTGRLIAREVTRVSPQVEAAFLAFGAAGTRRSHAGEQAAIAAAGKANSPVTSGVAA
jgi:hypothetical protein